MSPRMEPDFDWSEVQASIPVYEKGDYEISIQKVRGVAWFKKDAQGQPTSDVTKAVRLTVKMVGVYDSKGKLKFEQDGKNIKDQPAEDLNLWVHSDGGKRQAKQRMMAIAGYTPDDQVQEKEFNDYLKNSKLDLSTVVEENEDGSGLVLNIGEGWEKLLVGKNVRASLDKESRTQEGKVEPIIQQNYVRLSPVNKK